MNYDLVVIGAGAGGCFAAIRLAEFQPGAKICILEAARKPLSKVEISGGGRCNVTHACFDPEKLTTYYPRGREELLGPFNEFQPSDLISWFKEKGIKLKTEPDGRVFPVTDRSSTIIDSFMQEMKRHGIQLWRSTRCTDWHYSNEEQKWSIKLPEDRVLTSKYLLIASGSDQRIWNSLGSLGHTIISPVPSLFTFNILDKTLRELMGISKTNVRLSVPLLKMEATGPLLITHWGLSGPAILQLSAWGARELYDCGYVFDLKVNWMLHQDLEATQSFIQNLINENPKRKINKLTIPDFPARLWRFLCDKAGIAEFMSGAEFGKKQMKQMLGVLMDDEYRVTGKSTFKEEFVTAGGVDLADIDFKNFESKIHPGLFLVGEVINIDAITGGFNFQAAWTGAHIVATAIAKKTLKNP